MPNLALQLFGPPTILLTRDDSAARRGGGVCSGKGLGLLAYLALEPGPHTRDELATLLWGSSRDQAARTSLRQALKRLRALAGDNLRVDRATVELDDAVDCDVKAFLRATERQPLEAAGFNVPKFLDGFAPRKAPAFDEWMATTRQRLLHRYGTTLRAAARDALLGCRWRDAVSWADRWLAVDPLSDEATRTVMEALYLAGDRGAALSRFAAYQERLAREIGSKPSAALTELAQRIEVEAGPKRRAPAAEAPAGTPPAFEAGLVGREAPWRALLDTWQAAASGTGRVVFIEGEAGVGKTRLAEEFLRWVRLTGGTALRGRGYDAQTGIPYGPVVEALRGALDAPGIAATAPEWLTEAARLLPELRHRFPGLPPPPTPVDPGERWRLFEGIAQLVSSVAAERPVGLLIDDLQWCDGETCALLHYLTRGLARSPVMVVATLTLGELERDAPAARLYRALHAEAHAAVVPLGVLSEDELWRLIREMGRLQSPTGGRRLASRVHEVTDGNPFYATELLKTLFALGLLTADPETGEWLAGPVPEAESYAVAPLPVTVREAIAQRMTKLPYELRDLLTTVAVARRGVATDLLSHVHGMSRLRAAALGDALVDRRLLVEEQGCYRCAHPVIAEVVRDSLTPARRTELHRAIALSLITLGAPGNTSELAGEIARHAERGGERAVAYRYALLASEAAAGRYAFDEALSWLDVASGAAVTPEESGQVNRLTARVLELAGWSEAPRPASRRSGTGRGIERRDVDLGAPRSPTRR